MKRNLYLLLVMAFLAIVGTPVHSQDNKTSQITVAPLSIIDPLTGVIQLGIEQRLTYRWALSIDYGVKFNLLSCFSYTSERKNYRYYKTRLELKYFIKSPESHANTDRSPYLALQVFYFPQTYTKENDYVFSNEKYFQYDQSDIKRKAFAASVLGGYEIKQRRIIYDLYTGTGVRYIAIREQLHGAMEINQPHGGPAFHFSSLDRKEGTFYRLNILLGFKIGYVLK